EALIERLRSFPCEPGMLVTSVRSLAAAVLRFWLRVYHRLTIVGRQNLPADHSFVLIANHASHLDTLCLLSALPIRRLHRALPAESRAPHHRRAAPIRAFAGHQRVGKENLPRVARGRYVARTRRAENTSRCASRRKRDSGESPYLRLQSSICNPVRSHELQRT